MKWGDYVSLKYKEQLTGWFKAFIIGEKIIGNDDVCMIWAIYLMVRFLFIKKSNIMLKSENLNFGY